MTTTEALALATACARAGVHLDDRGSTRRNTPCESCAPAVKKIAAALSESGLTLTKQADLVECAATIRRLRTALEIIAAPPKAGSVNAIPVEIRNIARAALGEQ